MGERQIEISGVMLKDLFNIFLVGIFQIVQLINVITLLLNNEGGIICDPILLRLEENKFWISTSDCDLELWIKVFK